MEKEKNSVTSKKLTTGKKLLILFISMFYISSCTFGGGFVIVTFIKRRMVDELGWIDEKDMLDYIAFAQASPGAIAVNTAILVGYQVAGFRGLFIAVLGTILPPMIIISILSSFYQIFLSNKVIAILLKGMQAGVAAVILEVVVELAQSIVADHPIISVSLATLSFILVFFFHFPIMFILLFAILLGIGSTFLCMRKKREEH